jgi:hypothetical protein
LNFQLKFLTLKKLPVKFLEVLEVLTEYLGEALTEDLGEVPTEDLTW